MAKDDDHRYKLLPGKLKLLQQLIPLAFHHDKDGKKQNKLKLDGWLLSSFCNDDFWKRKIFIYQKTFGSTKTTENCSILIIDFGKEKKIVWKIYQFSGTHSNPWGYFSHSPKTTNHIMIMIIVINNGFENYNSPSSFIQYIIQQ